MSTQGLQRAGDFFRGERAKIRITLGIVKIIGGLILLYLTFMILSSFVPDVFTFTNMIVVFEVLFLFAVAILIALFTFIGMLVGYIFVISTAPLGNTTVTSGFSNGMTYLMRAFFEQVLFNGFNFDNAGIDVDSYLGSGADPFGPLAYMLLYSTRISYEKLFINGILTIALILMLITGVNFIFQGNMGQAAISFFLSQFILGFGYINSLVLPLTLDVTSFASLIGSTMFQIGFVSYIYLEYSLQTGYLNNIAQPALQRQKRVGKQLQALNEFKLGITKVGTDEEKKQSEIVKKQDQTEEGVSTALSAGTDSTTAKKFGAEAMAFLLDSSKDSVFHGATGEKEKMTGRLQRYYEGLLRHDKNLNKKLGGSGGKSFNPISILVPVIISMLIRLALLIYFSWLILNADIFFNFISFPKTLTQSIEFDQPESILLVLIPMIFLILGLSMLISWGVGLLTKSQELILRDESEVKKFIKKGVAIKTRQEGEELLKKVQPQKKGGKAAKTDSATQSDDAGTSSKRRRKRKKPAKK